jgi:glycine cleavage system H protein
MKMFSKTHEWVLKQGDTVKVGLSDFAQSELGDIVYVSLPEVGSKVVVGKSFSEVESVKAVSEIFSPVTGKVVAVNEELLDKPELINEAPYDAWLVEVEVEETEELMTEEEYLEFVKK